MSPLRSLLAPSLLASLLLSGCGGWDGQGADLPGGGWSDEPSAPLPPLPGCEHLAQESAVCLSVDLRAGGLPVALGLDSGEVCQPWPGAAAGQLTGVRSLARSGDALVACDAGFGGVASWSLGDGEVAWHDLPCGAATERGDELLLVSNPACAREGCQELDLYPSWGDVEQRAEPGRWEVDPFAGLALESRGDLLLAASDAEAGDHVELFDLATGGALGRLALEGGGAPIDGLSTTGGGELAVLVGDYVVRHDLRSGQRLGETTVDWSDGWLDLGGLDCYPGRIPSR